MFVVYDIVVNVDDTAVGMDGSELRFDDIVVNIDDIVVGVKDIVVNVCDTVVGLTGSMLGVDIVVDTTVGEDDSIGGANDISCDKDKSMIGFNVTPVDADDTLLLNFSVVVKAFDVVALDVLVDIGVVVITLPPTQPSIPPPLQPDLKSLTPRLFLLPFESSWASIH